MGIDGVDILGFSVANWPRVDFVEFTMSSERYTNE